MTERRLGHYRLERLLVEGGGVATWLASTEDGRRAVVKAAPLEALSPGQLLRLEHEAEVLGALRSPWLAPLLEAGRVDGQVYLAMGHVPGVSLAERLRAGPLAPAEAVRLGICLFGALEAVHAEGVLHRDVKPANLVVEDGRTVLIDFGLSRSALLPPSLAGVPGGTARYMSPEAAGLVPQDVGPAADLYSAGVVLFEALAGRPPFPQEDLGDLLRAHLSAPVPSLRGLVPRALDEVVGRLLRKDPRDRYRSAAAVRRDLEDLERALEQGDPDPPLVVGAHDHRDTLAEPAFVGREAWLRTLEQAWREAGAGSGHLVVVCGPSGSGKSRLLEEVAGRVAGRGTLALRGRAGEFARSPLQALSSVARDLARNADPSLAEHVRQGMLGWEQVGATVLPELAGLLGCEPLREGLEAFGERPTLQGLAAFVKALGSPERPALVLLDDVQWADGLTARLLEHLAREKSLGYTMVLVGTREERGLPNLPLDPMTAREVERLLASMGGPLPPRAAERVWELSGGNPFMASEIARGMAQAGILRPEAGGWTLEEAALDRLQTSDRAAALLRRRLEGLHPETLRLLALGALLAEGAILGREFGLEPLAALAGAPSSGAGPAGPDRPLPTGLIPRLDEARRAGVLWADAEGARFTFTHDRLQEGCLALLDPEERPEMHLRAAEWLLQHDPERVHALAWHFRRAGDPERAAPWALAAAVQARARYDLQGAEDNYRVALEGALGEARDQATEGLGDVLVVRGGYAEAEGCFRSRLERARGVENRARLLLKLSDLEAKRQNLGASRELAEAALHALGQPVPASDAACLLAALAEAAVHLGRRGRLGSAPPSPEDTLAIHLCERLMVANFFVDRWAAFLWAHMRGLNLAERSAPSRELASFYGLHVAVAGYLGLMDRATRFGERGLQLTAELGGDPVDQGRALLRAGFADLHAGRLDQARDRYQRSLAVLQQFGDPWDNSILRQNLAHTLFLLGRLPEAADLARTLWRESLAVGEPQGLFTSLRYLVRATGGELPAEGLPPELKATGNDYIRQLYLLEALGIAAMHRGDLSLAVTLLEEAGQVGRQRCRPLDYAPTLAWLATACRLQAEGCDPATGRHQDAWRRARRAAREAVQAAAGLPPFLPHPLREAGLLAAERGQTARARKLLERSLSLAREMGMEYEEALTLRARGRVEECPADDARASRMLRRLGAHWDLPGDETPPETLSLLDRYDQVLEAGRRIASAVGREEVFTAVAREGARLFRAQSCRLVALDAGWPAHGPLATLAAAALEAPDAVTLEEGMPAGPSESTLLEGVRSALACAVRVQGRPVACLVVDHRDVGGLFTEDDRRLARFLASMAGASLESDLGWRSLQESEQSLQALFEGAGVGIALVHPSGRVLRANPTLKETLGRRPGEVSGRLFREFVHPEDVEEVTRHFADLGAGRREAFSLEVRCWGPGDRVFWGQLTVTAVGPCPEGAPTSGARPAEPADRCAPPARLAVLSLADVSHRRLREVALYQEHERRLLSSELHDVIAQPLAGLAMRLQWGDAGPGEAAEACHDVLRHLGSLVFNLRAPSSIHLSEGAGLLLDRFTRETEVETHLEVVGDLRAVQGLPALFVYRILQEALNNVRRHAGARKVRVRLEAAGPRLRGRVADDGRGFDVRSFMKERPADRHFGLVGMRERAELLGGFLNVRRLRPGTEITFEVQAEAGSTSAGSDVRARKSSGSGNGNGRAGNGQGKTGRASGSGNGKGTTERASGAGNGNGQGKDARASSPGSRRGSGRPPGAGDGQEPWPDPAPGEPESGPPAKEKDPRRRRPT